MRLSPRKRVSAVRSVVIDRPLEQTLVLVRDIELLEPLERKARSVEVHPTDAGSGWYRIHGRLARLVPWTGDFSFTHSENGWHSADLHSREDTWRISGGFVVTPIDEHSCRVTHYEDYVSPAHLRWMHSFLVAYMRLSQVGEMRDLKRLVESRVPQTRIATTAHERRGRRPVRHQHAAAADGARFAGGGGGQAPDTPERAERHPTPGASRA